MEHDRRSAWVLVPRTDQKQVPWRNGKGSTREIAIDPPDATVAGAFRWRVSSAPVLSSGPFSQFAGIDRSLWLLEGAGMQLSIDGASHRLDQRLQRIDFAGESSVTAELRNGPVVDLNVMVARAQICAKAEIVCDAQHVLTGPASGLIVAIGDASIRSEDEPNQRALALADGDALRVEIAADQQVHVAVRGTALCAEFRRKPQD